MALPASSNKASTAIWAAYAPDRLPSAMRSKFRTTSIDVLCYKLAELLPRRVLPEDYRKAERKTLIFSQFTQILEILQAISKLKAFQLPIMTGSIAVDINASVIARVDRGKSTLAHALIPKVIIAAVTAGDMRLADSQDDGKEHGITIKSTAISIYFEMEKEDVEIIKQKTEGRSSI
ncbi:hypothetical protein DFJ58DRAFT_734946 [Suillus subalutaceus]|uniref:uncharacterized protein n=1 Tax=Suillus subalutaceus TaxID=48586 RepID=UPI001B863571|nr:uncharacterized protein DFJ58DRAFT_734946 [Suillus subalutaceus]KAG1836523.1 hypothetical protein DFJ58DRAFT_734946 [Suillus subalutaceus]